MSGLPQCTWGTVWWFIAIVCNIFGTQCGALNNFWTARLYETESILTLNIVTGTLYY